MGKGGPGKANRRGISVIDLMDLFPDEQVSRKWFEDIRWPDGKRTCPRCAGVTTKPVPGDKPMPYWCSDCRSYFSVKVGTIMESSRLPLRKWAIAFYLFATNIKGVSSMKLHRDLGITQKSAWYMAHRIRESLNEEATEKFAGPVEVDETYIGGKETNKHNSKKLKSGRGAVGKTAVAGIKDRKTNQIVTEVVERTDKPTLQGFVYQHTEPDTQVYTDEWAAYTGMNRPHQAVRHSAKEYVNGMASTNGMESHWAMLKRGYTGIYHHWSVKHLPRYVNEFEGRHNFRPLDTADQMATMVQGADGKRLTYATLIGPAETRNPGGACSPSQSYDNH